MTNENGKDISSEIEPGNFPFPLTKGPDESPYLTWLRNHSDYMATRGFLDYLRMGAVLLRGIILNFLILLIFILIASLTVGHLYAPQLRSLPTYDGFPLNTLELLAQELRQPKSTTEKWLEHHLSVDARTALKADPLPDNLQALILTDLRSLVGNRSISNSDYSKSRLNRLKQESHQWRERRLDSLEAKKGRGKKEQQELDGLKNRKLQAKPHPGLWSRFMTYLSLNSRSYDRSLNRRLVDDAFLDIVLAARLKNPKRPVDKWLASRLATESPNDDASSNNSLLIGLYDVWKGASIYDYKLFSGVDLRPETQRLSKSIDTNPLDIHRLNQLLLEDAYPEILTMDESSAAGKLFETGILPPMPVPFTLTRSFLLIALILTLFSPVLVLLVEIAGQKKSMERAGSDSSVNRRDKFERLFGFALLFIFAIFMFELLPVLVDKFHQFRVNPEMNWNAIFASMAGVSLTVLAGASKLLSVLGGAKKKLAMVLIGLLGVMAPLLVTLYVTEFLVYAEPLEAGPSLLVAALPAVFVLMILIVMVVGWFNKSFSFVEYLRLGATAAGILIVTGLLALFVFIALDGSEYIQHGWNHWFIVILMLELWLFCALVLDVNQTSINGLYRDRLASAYLVGADTRGDVGIEEDINLGEIGCHESGSIAPYHLVNVTLNLQGSKDPSVRDRNSDFFFFSKKFVGGHRTGYCRTETLEQVHPQMNLATAMAISAAAASPNMGKGTNPLMVAFMVLLNIRLGYWLPNPGILEEQSSGSSLFARMIELVKRLGQKIIPGKKEPKPADMFPSGFIFAEVFEQELIEIEKRWNNVYRKPSERKRRRLKAKDDIRITTPTTKHNLVGLGFSGGGIRSATINLGIAQVLYDRGVFDHVDYMSTVSGGGYLGASLSTLMRTKAQPVGESSGATILQANSCSHRSEIEGVVGLEKNPDGEPIISVTSVSEPGERREYRYSRFDTPAVKNNGRVKAGQALLKRYNSLWNRFRWRVSPLALVHEMLMKLDERHKWVNLSDGGHIENLAGIELLRRRCKFIIIGDGEADPELTFNGLSTLIRYARIDLGIRIDINPDAIRVSKSNEDIDKGRANLSREHMAFGTIIYPPTKDNGYVEEKGCLLYLKSSYSGDEDEVIKEYRYRNPSFPHESTADQSFCEDQFECYRALGQHIGEKACEELSMGYSSDMSSFDNFAENMKVCSMVAANDAKARLYKKKKKKESKWKKDLAISLEVELERMEKEGKKGTDDKKAQ